MQVICIKCHKNGSLSLNHNKSNNRVYKYYGIQHYDSSTMKRKWCYLGKYESLPESYKLVIHNNHSVSTSDPQTETTGKTHVFSENRGAGSGIRTHAALRHGILRAPIQDFKEFCLIDLGLAEATVQIHVREITKFLHYMKRKRGPITRTHIRQYLLPHRNNPNIYRKQFSALRRFFRDYLEEPDLVKSFRFPSNVYRPKRITNKDTLQAFFPHLPCEEAKLIFLFYASSGLRRNEALELRLKDIDLDQHMILPKSNGNRTKHCYLTFYNSETKSYLEDYIKKTK